MTPNFLDILDRKFTKNITDREAKRGGYEYRHNPSSASIKIGGKVHGACLRQLYYKAKKEPRSGEIDPTGLYQMAFGDYIHEGLLKELSKCPEISVSPESGGSVVIDELSNTISYRVDGLVSANGEIGGLEIKTVQGRALTGKGYGIKTTGPKMDHILQVVTYLNVFKGLKWFALVYVARDTGYRIQYNFTVEGSGYLIDGKPLPDVTFDKIKERWAELEKHLKDGTIPARDYSVWLKKDGTIQPTKYVKGDFISSSYKCLYCPYAKKCWSEPGALEDSMECKSA